MTIALRPRPTELSTRPWRFPSTERGVLANGTRVVLCDLPDRPVVEVRVVWSGGARRDPIDKFGVGMIATRALSEGTRRLSNEEFNEAVESLGAQYGFSLDWNSITASLSAPKSRLQGALALLAEAVCDPAFRESDIERLTRQGIVGIESTRMFPGPRAQMEFAGATFLPGSRMAVPGNGTPESLARITADDIRRFWRGTTAPVNATIIVAGDLRGLAVEAMLNESIGAVDADVLDERRTPGEEVPSTQGQSLVVDFPGAVQSNILVGCAAASSDVEVRPVLGLANHCLGGFFTSRLNTVLREEKSLTYGVSSSISNDGPVLQFRVDTAVQRDSTDEAIRDIAREVAALRNEPPQAGLFAAAVGNATRMAPIGFRSTGAVVAALVKAEAEGLPDGYYDWAQERQMTATPEEVSKVFAQHVDEDALSVVVAGDAAAFVDGLRCWRGNVVVEPAAEG